MTTEAHNEDLNHLPLTRILYECSPVGEAFLPREATRYILEHFGLRFGYWEVQSALEALALCGKARIHRKQTGIIPKRYYEVVR